MERLALLLRAPADPSLEDHPGAVIAHTLRAIGACQTQLAHSMRIPLQRLHQIIHGRRRITPDTAVRLSRCIGQSVDDWLTCQMRLDLANAQAVLRDTQLTCLVPHAGSSP